jgi:hypothetical protein
MRHSTIEDLVLLNHALLAEAEEVRARHREVQFRHLLVVAKCLMSSTYDPPWVSVGGSHKNAARYRRLANTAWACGLADWRRGSSDLIAASRVARAEAQAGLDPGAARPGGRILPGRSPTSS